MTAEISSKVEKEMVEAELERFESALLEGIRIAQEVAEHNSESKVKPEQLMAALLTLETEAERDVDKKIADALHLEVVKKFALQSHQPSCPCTQCQRTAVQLTSARPDSHGNRLAAVLPFG